MISDSTGYRLYLFFFGADLFLIAVNPAIYDYNGVDSNDQHTEKYDEPNYRELKWTNFTVFCHESKLLPQRKFIKYFINCLYKL
jgi:hypothetical protein